ncbi:LVIVD repeat-containing protein [Egicoccus sp. AB-alg2]|uniref:LVIVD repeat-containing protein n=1 Tax=Egicoccus sp. AB-alg2 TaxID=3242693 RepID=UPI00359EB070
MNTPKGGRSRLRTAAVALAATSLLAGLAPAATAQDEPTRRGLAPGIFDAESAMTPNVAHLSTTPRTEQAPDRTNSDMAFTDGHVIVGNYGGFNIYDVANPDNPRLVTTVSCPGNQHDVSVEGDLLFVSVQTYNTSFDDCTTSANATNEPFAGIRVFDISNKARPQQVAAVQTCRGSHTHTLVPDPAGESAFIYVSGTSSVRRDAPGQALGCATAASGAEPLENDARWRIDIVEVPLERPQDAVLLDDGPRLMAEGDRIDGLQQAPPTPLHPSGPEHRRGGIWSPRPVSDSCHDITVYPEIGLAAGACEGNGLLIDVTDPRNPVRVAAAADGNFAYWHSATFNNDGTKVVFTDEWGGGGQGYCTEAERPEWGANGIYDIQRGDDGSVDLVFRSYYKIPPDQEWNEICVAHNGNLIPVPGRDIMVQAWYQGGMTVFDFTDSANPVELAWFDRGPIQTDPEGAQQRGGFWSTYWYDGLIYGTDITRGFDVLELSGSDELTQNEVDAARTVREDQTNPQTQARYDHPATFVLVRAYLDQLVRGEGIDQRTLTQVTRSLDRAEDFAQGGKAKQAVTQLRNAERDLGATDADDVRDAIAALIAELG